MAIYKNANLDISVAAEQNPNYNAKPSVQFSTQDKNTAKYTFTVKQNNKPVDLTGVTASVTLFSEDKSVFQSDANITSATEGKIEYVIPADAIRHHGKTRGDLRLTYPNGDVLGGLRFTFNIEQALIDRAAGTVGGVYIRDFETLKAEIQKTADSIKDLDVVRIDSKLNELEEQIGEGAGVDEQARQKIEEVTEQLAETAKKSEIQSLVTNKADKTYVEQITQSLASGAPKAAYATHAALKTAFPTGNTNIYLVLADGKWYRWDATAVDWVSGGVYQATVSNILPATNRVTNGNFAGITGWNAFNGTLTASNNVATLIGNGTAIGPYISRGVGNRDITHKYYGKISVRAITEGITTIQLSNGVTTSVNNPVLNQWYDIDVIFTPPTNAPWLNIIFRAADAAAALDKKLEIKSILEIDLTEVYGAGKEPTISEIRSTLELFPNKWFEGTASLFNDKQLVTDVKTLKEKKISETDLLPNAVTAEKIPDSALPLQKLNIGRKSKNLFNGKYEDYQLYGALATPEMFKDANSRTAIIPIEPNESYSINIIGEKDAFRVATSVNRITLNQSGKFFPNNFLLYNDNARQFSFTNNATNRYLYIKVSSSKKEPLMQVEKGNIITPYESPVIISESVLPKKEDSAEFFLPTLTNTELISTPVAPRFIDYFDGKMWGYRHDGAFCYSTDEGRTWTPHTITWDHDNWGWAERLVPTSDGEMMAVSETQIRKSRGWKTGTVTWSNNKITPNVNCVFPIFGFDGDGTKFIITEYGKGGTTIWKDSRFVHISTDSGETFRKVWDSLERHGAEINALTHVHSSCYDRWADRFYFSEGHSPAGGLYYSDDDGATWHQAAGHRDGVMYSQGIVDKVGDTNGPTVIVATDEGLVMGSDHQNNGVFGLLRKDNPEDEVVEWIYQTSYERKGVQMFAQRGWRDPDTGTVYITFRAEWDDVPPIIVSATPRKAKLAYEYPQLPVRGGSDRFMAIAKPSPDRIVANGYFGGQPHIFRADVKYPNTEVTNLIRIELKKLGLI